MMYLAAQEAESNVDQMLNDEELIRQQIEMLQEMERQKNAPEERPIKWDLPADSF